MSDYPYSSEQQSSNAPEYSVTELSVSLKRFVEENFGYVRVRGEISGFKQAASGHVYLALKDEKSVLDGVMWKGTAGRLNFRPEDGLEVICTGKLTTYPGRSKYQIVIDRMEPAGAGALMALLEERKKKLAAEGLFEPSRKKPIPYLPEVIGVVTSPTGAVIRDILHRLRDRFPRRVLVWPVLVQGEGAADQITEAIRGFNQMPEGGDLPRPDVLIVARGGGSLEDLWSFNEENVVRAAAESRIPLISAVGHETDTTLIDYASDRRAPTPTAAAEMAVPVRADLVYTVEDLVARQNRAVQRLLAERRQRVEGLGRGLPKPQDLLSLSQQKFDDFSERLPRALKNLSDRQQMRLETVSHRLRSDILVRDIGRQTDRTGDLGQRLDRAAGRQIDQHRRALESSTRLFDSLNYKRVLDRGYAVIRGDDGKAVTVAADVSAGNLLDIEFRDGHVAARAEGDGPPKLSSPQKKQKRPAKSSPKSSKDDRQESLF
ncbi:exodeoxyribonuclease VII large subunit [Emcibacter sp.]|uniref:exodeoxyribonuclease VII large subunit n=1 Tax=Emcibacter sp. TaxID=1979954 RepID=UPI003A910A34